MNKSDTARDIETAPHTESIKGKVRAIAEGHEKDVGGIAGKRLKSLIDRIERIEEEKQARSEDIKDIYTEAKGTGFEPKIIRRIIRLRKMEPDKRREENELLGLYQAANRYGIIS